MTYIEIGRFMKALQEADKTFMLKALIVIAVQTYMDLRAYDDEGFEEICSNFEKAVIDATRAWPSLGVVAWKAQILIDITKFETPSVECFKRALKELGFER